MTELEYYHFGTLNEQLDVGIKHHTDNITGMGIIRPVSSSERIQYHLWNNFANKISPTSDEFLKATANLWEEDRGTGHLGGSVR